MLVQYQRIRGKEPLIINDVGRYASCHRIGRLINMPFYFRFPEICFVALGVLPLTRPFSRPQKRYYGAGDEGGTIVAV
jgi:hypothetical protein